MNRGALNLALIALAIALGVGIWFSGKKEEKGPPLLPIATEAVTAIRIAHPDSPAIELKKDGGHWMLTAPVQGDADAMEVTALTDLAAKETHDPIATPDLKQLGLDPPGYTIALNGTPVDFGGIEPIKYRRYVRTGSTVALIEDPASAALDKDYSDLVAKELFPAGSQVEKIELPKLTLGKDDKDHWQLTPADPKAGADQMERLAQGWLHARAMWNEAAQPADAKAGRVKITLKGGTVREFVVVATDPQLKLQREDLKVNYVLSKALADELLKLPEPAAPQKAEEKK
jgi:hypothetical protein